jgi:hypothetical protein
VVNDDGGATVERVDEGREVTGALLVRLRRA